MFSLVKELEQDMIADSFDELALAKIERSPNKYTQ